jgi:hypothetical protein
LHRHVQPVSRLGHAAFFGDNPKIVQMPVTEGRVHNQFNQKFGFFIICFLSRNSQIILIFPLTHTKGHHASHF